MTMWLLPLFLFPSLTIAINSDGALLLAFKSTILSDPFSSLLDWNSTADTPCWWNGVTCINIDSNPRVISLILPNADILASLPPELGLMQHLRHLDLSNNFLNGTLPATLFNASELSVIDLGKNEISGEFPGIQIESFSSAVQVLNLSDNALSGELPGNLTVFQQLKVLSVANNYFLGSLPLGMGKLDFVDISSNLINGTLPDDVMGHRVKYLNLSYNRISGEIPPEMGFKVSAGAVVDLSENELTGEIPSAFESQKAAGFQGNRDLCGRPLRVLCSIPSTLSTTSAPVTPRSPPALAAMPRDPSEGPGQRAAVSLKPVAIIGIIAGDVVGIGLLFMLFLYVYKMRKRGSQNEVKKKPKYESSMDSETEVEDEAVATTDGGGKQGVALVTVDGETELELETLLKASAYILGAAGASIVYKAVLADGTALAVRRIGDGGGGEKMRDFEAQVRSIARYRHPNVLRIRGFYWGVDEKLLIHDYAANGSLASVFLNRKLSWDTRLRIAKGVARGLAYLHEKKSVHGSIKPSNILLGDDMEPRIGDFGLERLVDTGSKSTRNFGSKRSTQSLPELSPTDAASNCSGVPYQAPEALRSLKPSVRWDVYSFGVVLLELLAGRTFTETELCAGFVAEERNRVLRLADPALRSELAGKEEAMLVCFKLGFTCAAIMPQRRPAMKDVLQVLEKIPDIASLNQY